MGSEIRDRVRSAVNSSPRKATYPTRRDRELAFKQIEAAIRPRAAKVLLIRNRVSPQDLDDCLQNGLMYIGEQLAENRDLSKTSRLESAIIVCYRSKASSICKQNIRYEYIDDYCARSQYEYPEEHEITGLEKFKIGGGFQ